MKPKVCWNLGADNPGAESEDTRSGHPKATETKRRAEGGTMPARSPARPALRPIKGTDAERETQRTGQTVADDEHRRDRISAFNDETAAHLETERLRRLNQAHYVKTETRILSLVTRN